MANTGETVILGGLIDEDVQESVQKVPLLGDLPFIGHLFKSTSNTTRKRNLMVFIRPTIITSSAMMNTLAKDKYNFIRADQIRKREEGLSLMHNEKLPLLPDWNDVLTLPPAFDEYMDEGKQENSDGSKEELNPPSMFEVKPLRIDTQVQ
jgi:general secretion pathway protein D